MDRPDVLLFDVMGTLVHDPFHVEMPAFFGMSLEELLAVKHPNAWVRFERGELSERDLLASFFADGRTFDGERFVAMLRESYRFLDGIEPLLRDLSRAKVPMHAFTNYPCWYRLIEERLALSHYVEWSFVSCETKLRKPDHEAYLCAARKLGTPLDRCLFVDDRATNCRAARTLGMDAIHFEDAAQLRADLRKRRLL
jgi:HAD superfamily hydrolase (TIGR01509 family)